VEVSTINAAVFAKMFLAGAKNLEAKKEWINELNVFPVPDGDTGTNMTMTITAAASEVSALADVNMETLAKCISSGSLRGARGNSGVILSQLLRGFTKGIRDHEKLDVVDLANAMDKAVKTAYKAVMKPKEGTILTVAKGAADKAADLASTVEDVEEFCRLVIEEAEEVLAQTPEMLPVLKKAGVVDAGGQGFVEIWKGMLSVIENEQIIPSEEEAQAAPKEKKAHGVAAEFNEEDIHFCYCTEFIINKEHPDAAQTRLCGCGHLARLRLEV